MSKSYTAGNWSCFSFLKTFHLSSKCILPFLLTGGELQAFKLGVGVSFTELLRTDVSYEFRAGLGHRQCRQMLGAPSSAGGTENGGRKKK